MDFLRRWTPQRPQSELLVVPPPRRLSTPAGQRLTTILENHPEDADGNAPPQSNRHSGHTWGSRSPRSHAGTLPRFSAEHMPPPYAVEWRPEDVQYFDKEEEARLARLKKRRGGWGRVAILAGIIVILAVALGVGLGVGLSRKRNSGSGSTDSEGSSSNATQSFPLGQYSFTTALRNVSTDCTSNSATWRCYPYSTFQSDDSANGAAVFNWILTRTDSNIATNSTPGTNGQGVRANITLTSSSNPFAITISNQSLTYVNDDNNPRYTMSYVYAKTVTPSAALNSDNAASTCFFNQTTVSASIYLSDSRVKDYPSSTLTNSGQVQGQLSGGYTAWPYAVEISETAGGGQDVPNCYELTNGVPGARIGDFATESASQQCACDYRNFSD